MASLGVPGGSKDHGTNVNLTYLGLRLGMVLLVVMLFVAVGWVIFGEGDWLESVSAYYFTPARAVFIGALSAIGAALIIYRGNTPTENILLDFAGFLAFVVAFIPTDVEEDCDYCTGLSSEEVTAAITNNMAALFVTGAVAMAVWILWGRKLIPGAKGQLDKAAKRSVLASLAALTSVVLYFAVSRESVEESGHNWAAGGLFVFIVLVVAINAWGSSGETSVRKAAVNPYGIIAGLMISSFVVLFFLRNSFAHWLFVLEALLIFGFAAFWVIQTLELQGTVGRVEDPQGTKVAKSRDT